MWITNQLAGYKPGVLTGIKNKFSLGNTWSTFCTDCRGSGGAAVCLCKRSFPSTPSCCPAPRTQSRCPAAADGGGEGPARVQQPPFPSPVFSQTGGQARPSTALPLRVTQSSHIFKLLDWQTISSCTSRSGTVHSARPFPKHVQQDPGFVERLQVLADMFAGYSAAAANDPGRLCELWEALKKSIVKEAHRYAKQLRKRAYGARQALQKQFHDKNTQPQSRARTVSQIRQLEVQEVEQELHRRSVHRLSTWERPCHDFDTHGKERPESFTLPAVPREKLLAQATEFYAKLFQEDQPLSKEPELLKKVSSLGSCVPHVHFTADTILEALGSCKSNKSPGPDSIPVEVWKSIASRIAEPLAQLCNFIRPSCIPPSWRQGKINLISKCKEGQMPQSLNDARPITLLNSDYKIFSKALALHLGKFMPQITVAEQRAFVHGRDIRCNIILAESLLYRDPPVDGALLSLDWAKAYDRVSYAYHSQVLRSYRFNRGLRNKIEATMYGFSLSLAAPEGPQPSFPRLRGVGQGCPCAPLLFALAIDLLPARSRRASRAFRSHSRLQFSPRCLCAPTTP